MFCSGFIYGGGDSLKIMTYNLQGMKPGTEPEVRFIHIIDKIIEIDPDIIGLQEINESLNGGGADNQAKVIADSLSEHFGIPYYYYNEFTHLSWNNQFREFVGIMTKYPVEERGFAQLVAGTFPRKVVWNKINTPLGTINFFNTHLSFNSSSVRVQQVQQIISYINVIEFNHPAIAIILTGDFNDTPNTTSIQQLTSTGTDTFYVSTYAYVNPGDPGFTVASNIPTSKIDYVFIKNTASIEPFESAVVMNQPYSGNFCSDHLGVLTCFRDGVMSIEDESFIQPEEIKLYQNYPNPFNPTTKIKYSVNLKDNLNRNGSVPVRLTVFDVLGREVATLVNESKSAGIYEIEFNIEKQAVSSAVLFYQLKAGNNNETKKMLLIN
jgi:endonuclease/exonuclease/phosphatase family metal-dependent hydrolase